MAAVAYHGIYEGNPADVDGLPGGVEWRARIEAIPEAERHLALHEDHFVAVTERDRSVVTGDVLRMFTWTDEAPALRARLDALAAARRDGGPLRGRWSRRRARVARVPRHGGGIVRAHARAPTTRPERCPAPRPARDRRTPPGADATQAVSRPPADATQAARDRQRRPGRRGRPGPPVGRRRRRSSATDARESVGDRRGRSSAVRRWRIALATQDDDSTSASTSTTSSSTTSTSTSSHVRRRSTSTSSSTTTTTSTTHDVHHDDRAGAADHVVRRARAANDCPDRLESSSRGARRTRRGDDQRRRAPGSSALPASGSTTVPFDCGPASHSYPLTTTGGAPAATRPASCSRRPERRGRPPTDPALRRRTSCSRRRRGLTLVVAALVLAERAAVTTVDGAAARDDDHHDAARPTGPAPGAPVITGLRRPERRCAATRPRRHRPCRGRRRERSACRSPSTGPAPFGYYPAERAGARSRSRATTPTARLPPDRAGAVGRHRAAARSGWRSRPRGSR